MGAIVAVYGRKMLSLSLIFNSLLTITYAVGLLTGLYAYNWQLFPPYLVDGNLFWLIILGSVVNIFPAAFMGQIKMGRLWFHHYVYGFLVIGLAVGLLALFAPLALPTLFTSNVTDIGINVGRFFILGGLALVLDDLPDVSVGTKRLVDFLKLKAYQSRRALHWAGCLLGFVSLYFIFCVCGFLILNPGWASLANFILIGSLMVTSLTCFWAFRRKIWLNINLASQ
jgi:hypothetical protein